jgi:hypothetical protein
MALGSIARILRMVMRCRGLGSSLVERHPKLGGQNLYLRLVKQVHMVARDLVNTTPLRPVRPQPPHASAWILGADSRARKRSIRPG